MRAISVTLDDDVDLDGVCRDDGLLFARDRVGVAGRDVVARLDDPAALAAIPHDDRAGGARVVAFATLPFDPASPACILVPGIGVVRRADGCAVLTVVGDDPDVDAAVASVTAPVAAPTASAGSFDVRPLSPVPHYLDAVRAARDAVRSGSIAKAVIAREVQVRAERPLDVQAILLRLRASFGSSYRYCVDGLIGASPELLIAVDGPIVRSHPLAGTAPRTGDPDADARVAAALVASTKDQVEHRVVIDTIYDTLLPHCSYLDWEAEPSVLTVANVQHLATRDGGPAVRAASTGDRVGPGAVADTGTGRRAAGAALQLIKSVEGFERGRYGGAVGWLDSAGDGTFAVTIRCAELSEDRRAARLVAGGGIVAGSDPHAELAETQAKLQAMLAAIVRP
ncbi:MAG: chorismate-binding protein [Ilumatobacteraceae bacterium]